jgi:hypothetical protein
MVKREEIKANKPVPGGQLADASMDLRTQGYIDGVIDVKKREIKQELAEELKKEIDSTAEKIKKDFQETINQNQTRVIEALAVFVALFTYISTNVDILRNVKDLMSASIFMIFMALLTMVIVSFPLTLLSVLRNDPAPKWVWWILLASIILLIVVFLFSLRINIPLNQLKD